MSKGSINKVFIIGNLGSDPEVKYTQSGDAVTTLSVATTDSWKDKAGEQQEKTEWHRVVLWRKTAEIAGQYLKKGSKVYIEGSLETRKWEDKDGVTKYTTEIKGREMQMMGGQAGGGGQQSNNGGFGQDDNFAAAPAMSGGGEEDDLPF